MIDRAIGQDGNGIYSVTSHITIFTEEEKECVVELWQDYIQLGSEKSGYHFIVFRDGELTAGFACYGLRSLTVGTYDLYWIAVDPSSRRKGVGRELLQRVEEEIRKLGGKLVFVETSSLKKYESTRHFYKATGYIEEAIIRDFYSPGDDLVIFTKHL